jgi:hypothetical protein
MVSTAEIAKNSLRITIDPPLLVAAEDFRLSSHVTGDSPLVQAVGDLCAVQVTPTPWRTCSYDTEEVEIRLVTVRTERGGNGSCLGDGESFQRWHRAIRKYMLPLPLQGDAGQNQIVGSALAKVLPYAPYSSVVDERLTRNHRYGIQQ